MSVQNPAVIVARSDGVVVSQNRAARRILGDSRNQTCWQSLSNLDDVEGLPCRNGCVRQLLARGLNGSRHGSFSSAGQRFQLSCVPVQGQVVCALTPGGGEQRDAWQDLTARERSVLELLAGGATTESAARQLGISPATIRTHVEKMRVKLGVSTRAALVANGFRLGYLK
jgi:DNA-binding CsgD family transcriptional regulator